jgi:hypothetical protein
VDVKMRKAHNLLWACRRTCEARLGLGPKVALCRNHSAFHLICTHSMVTWLSNGWFQDITKQNTKMCMLRDNRSYPYHSYQCHGGTHWPPSTGSSDTE